MSLLQDEIQSRDSGSQIPHVSNPLCSPCTLIVPKPRPTHPSKPQSLPSHPSPIGDGWAATVGVSKTWGEAVGGWKRSDCWGSRERVAHHCDAAIAREGGYRRLVVGDGCTMRDDGVVRRGPRHLRLMPKCRRPGRRSSVAGLSNSHTFWTMGRISSFGTFYTCVQTIFRLFSPHSDPTYIPFCNPFSSTSCNDRASRIRPTATVDKPRGRGQGHRWMHWVMMVLVEEQFSHRHFSKSKRPQDGSAAFPSA